MKVIIATEYLHQKDWVITILEEVISLFPEAHLMSLTYSPMSLGSKIESRMIVSSKIAPEKITKKPWMIPPMLKNMNIPEDTDLLVTLSRGYIHQIQAPKSCKHINYQVDFAKKTKGLTGFIQGLLSSAPKGETHRQDLYLSEFLASKFVTSKNEDQKQVLKPFFKLGIHEFDPLVERLQEDAIDCIIHISNQTSRNLEKIGELLVSQNIKFLFHGDDYLLDQKIKSPHLRQEHCYEKGCHGSEQKLFENAKMFVDLTEQTFNPFVFQALSAGVGVYIPQQIYKNMIPSEFSMNFLSQPNIKEALECSWWESFDPKAARRHALRLNGRVFKRRFSSLVAR